MDKILFVDAALRRDSRTRALAGHLLERLDGDVTHLKLYEEDLPTLTEALIDFRGKCADSGDFSDGFFRYARQFADADTIVIAAPFWDNSFPAVLKKYIEALCVVGVTFFYTPEGIPQGLCRAKSLYYVTTAGGPIYDASFSFGYVKSLAQQMFGIESVYFLKAENLDIFGADVPAIMAKAFADAEAMA